MGVSLFVELFESKIYHEAGCMLSGQIFLEVSLEFRARALMLYLRGFEDVAFGTRSKYCGRA